MVTQLKRNIGDFDDIQQQARDWFKYQSERGNCGRIEDGYLLDSIIHNHNKSYNQDFDVTYEFGSLYDENEDLVYQTYRLHKSGEVRGNYESCLYLVQEDDDFEAQMKLQVTNESLELSYDIFEDQYYVGQDLLIYKNSVDFGFTIDEDVLEEFATAHPELVKDLIINLNEYIVLEKLKNYAEVKDYLLEQVPELQPLFIEIED